MNLYSWRDIEVQIYIVLIYMYIHHTPIDTYDQYYDYDNYRFLVVKGW